MEKTKWFISLCTSLFVIMIILLAITACSQKSSLNNAHSSTSTTKDVTNEQKITIYQMTSIFENSTPELQYGYVENIGDGRGYTFGYVGFCSGTFDGNLFLKEYKKLNPNNSLVSYISKFDYIDSLPHPNPDGLCGYLENIPNFVEDFQKCSQSNDPAFIQAQLNVANDLYWQPSQKAANEIGAKNPITFGQLYDAFMNMGEDGARSIMDKATGDMNGTPATGVDENAWLTRFLSIRQDILKSDPVWQESTDRIVVYQTLLSQGNVNLNLPITLTCYGSPYTLDKSPVKP